MRVLSVFLGIAGLPDVGYRFYDATETPIAARSTAGVNDCAQGYYSVNADVPANAASVRWDSVSQPDATAREYFDSRISFIATKTALIQSGNVTAVFPVSENGSAVELITGDDYLAADGRALEFSSDDWPDLTGGTVLFKLGSLSVPALVTAARSVRVELTSAQTRNLKIAKRTHELEATLANGHVVTLLRGCTTVVSDL